MKSFRFYIKIYHRYFSQSLKRHLVYRSDFLVQITFALSTQIASLIFVLTIFEHIPNLNGWSFAEVLFIYGFAQTAMALFSFFFENLTTLGRNYILDGQLDRVLLRPLNPLFQIIAEWIDFGSLSTLGMGVGALGYACTLLDFSWSITMWCLLGLLIFCASLLLAGLVLILVSFTFWIKDSTGAIIWPLMILRDFAKYPITIYSPALQVLLSWIFPIAFTSFYPASLFLQKETYHLHAYLTPVMTLVVWAVGYSIWRVGQLKYESAGT